MFNFEKLDVWQKSIALGDLVLVTKSFPTDERFGLTNQMRRAAVSISANIAEGSSRHSKADFRRFIEIATGSTFEVVSQARIARNQAVIASNEHDRVYQAALEIVRMLSGLHDSLRD